jgi:S-(hydroxymethyl)glutathione dehydrogenase / alcohol dehydrogenase
VASARSAAGAAAQGGGDVKAAVLQTIPGDLVIDDVQVDKPGPREVLIDVAAAGCCHSDLHFMEGKYPYMTPVVMGHEASGVVAAVGDEVTHVKPGDHVITCLSVFCGQCDYCIVGKPHLCTKEAVRRPDDQGSRLSKDGEPVFQFLDLSAFAEQMLVHEGAVVRIRDDMPLDRAALIGCGVTTGLGAVFNTAGVRPGETVAVIGCGGVGLSAIQGARIAGAGRIIAIDMVNTKLDMARAFGATDVVNAGEGDPVAHVAQLTLGGVDHAFEAIGLKVAAEQAFGMVKAGGCATVIGMIPVGQNVELPGVAFLAEKKIQGSVMGSNRFRVDMPRYVDMYLQGQLNLDDMISDRLPLKDVNTAFEAMKTGEIARDVIVFE